MNDIQLADGASTEIGRLYRDAKAFSIDAPVQALLSLRGLAATFCDCLDHGLTGLTLADKITRLDQQEMLKPKVNLITHDPQPASRADMASEGLPRLHAPIQPTCS